MTNPPKPEDAPEGFWEEFGQELGKLFTTDEGKQSLMDTFLTQKGEQAPAPQPNDAPADPPAKKKGWFTSSD